MTRSLAPLKVWVDADPRSAEAAAGKLRAQHALMLRRLRVVASGGVGTGSPEKRPKDEDAGDAGDDDGPEAAARARAAALWRVPGSCTAAAVEQGRFGFVDEAQYSARNATVRSGARVGATPRCGLGLELGLSTRTRSEAVRRQRRARPPPASFCLLSSRVAPRAGRVLPGLGR